MMKVDEQLLEYIREAEWRSGVYISGTTNAQPMRRATIVPFIGFHYAADIKSIGLSDDECDRRKRQMAESVAEYLNGGPRPLWLGDCERAGDRWLRTPLGGKVAAIGPMVLPPDDSGRLNWRPCESDHSIRFRKLLCDVLQHGWPDA
jgi:hypothetical protein